METVRSLTQQSLDRQLRVLGVAAIVLIGGAGSIGAMTKVSGAVVATGKLVVQSHVKKVQHPSGGVVRDLLVDEGDHVEAGQVLVRLDATIARATLATVEQQIWELEAREARLDAQQQNASDVTFPSDLLVAKDPAIEKIMAGEKALFAFQRESTEGQKRQLQQVAQLNEEISGLEVQVAAKSTESDLLQKELASIQALWQKNLIGLSVLTSTERDDARTSGEKGQLVSSIAQTKGKIAETQLKIIQVDQDMRTDVAKELADVRAKLSDLQEKRVTARDTLDHIEIRAPQSGYVQQLSVHTRGGVISAGEQIMLIVPDLDRLLVEVRVPPQDIDQVHLDQVATLRLPNFNQRTTPELPGRVIRVSADTIGGGSEDAAYYAVQLEMKIPAGSGIDRTKLRPGMPTDAFIQTSDRTIGSYLIKPLADQMHRAFREK